VFTTWLDMSIQSIIWCLVCDYQYEYKTTDLLHFIIFIMFNSKNQKVYHDENINDDDFNSSSVIDFGNIINN